jgi:hypothetical protein
MRIDKKGAENGKHTINPCLFMSFYSFIFRGNRVVLLKRLAATLYPISLSGLWLGSDQYGTANLDR